MATKVGGIKMSRIQIEYVDPADLSPNSYNPNVHQANTFDGLLDSIKRWGFTQPVVADRKTREIIDGEHRWRCSFVLGFAEIPVVFLDLPELEMRLATIAHNEARGQHCPQLRKQIEMEFAEAGFDMDKTLKKDRLAQ